MDWSQTMWIVPESLKDIEKAGDDSIVLELIDSFQDDTASRLQRLHEAVTRCDADRVKAEAHSVRGAARQMGAEGLAELCRAVEAGAPQRNWPELEDQVNRAEVQFAEVRTAMSEYVSGKRRGR
jgi:HPt (histidine-containing phosphotransfer) domain-containing protein